MPYSAAEVERLEALIDAINAAPLEFVVHVGDLGSAVQACTEPGWIEARRTQLARIRHPLVVLPGDNEWSDCARFGLDPLDRLARWRALFCGTRLPAERQPGEYCEHLRWEAAGYVFVTLNVPGHRNNDAHPEHRARTAAALEWLDAAAARAAGAKGLVVLVHANPFLAPTGGAHNWLLERLAALGARQPVLLVHGDTHVYKDDFPLPGVRRIEVWGSPAVDWHRIELP